MSKRLIFAFLALVLGIAFAVTQSTSSTNTMSYLAGNPQGSACSFDATAMITHNSVLSASVLQGGIDTQTFCPGTVTINTSKITSAVAGTILWPSDTSYTTVNGNSNVQVPHNFDSSNYNTLISRLSSCQIGGSGHFFYCYKLSGGGGDIACPSGCDFAPSNGGLNALLNYKPAQTNCNEHPFKGDVFLYCDGTVTINGQAYNINSVPASVSMSVSPGVTNIPVSMQYRCIALTTGYRTSNFYKYGVIYNNNTNVSLSMNIPINVLPSCGCSNITSISLSSPPINLNCSNNQSNITLTVTNTGNMPVTVNTITASVGTFTLTPTSQLPKTLAPGQSYQVNGTFTYNGATPSSVTFTASGNATNCSQQVTVTATSVSSINKVVDNAAVSITGTSPISLNCSNQSLVTLTITNNGNVPITVTQVSVSGGTFVQSPPNQLPHVLNPGQSFQLTGVLTYNGALPTSITFTVTANGSVCGVQRTVTNTWTATVNSGCTVCPDRYSFTISAAPNPLTLNSTNQAQITFTVTNTGNITMNLTNIVASTGTLSNFNPTLPITGIAPGQSRTITATYTWTGGSTSVVFTATTTAYPCAVASTLTNTTGVVIVNPPCPDRYSFTISAAPNPLTLNSTNQAQITFTVTNTGNITMNLTNIVASTGTLSNFNPTLPITGIAPGQSRTITATYTWTGGSTSVVFTATTTAYPCAVASTLTNTTGVVIVNPPCPDRYSFTISAAPNPLTLNSTNQAQITFTVTNTGNITMNLTNIVASTGTLSNFNPTLPITGIAPGQSRTITATYTWTGGSTSVVFTATTTAYPCAVASTLTNTTGVVIVNPPCPDRYSFTISAAPNPLTLNSTNQAQITFTVTNTGNITMNLTNIVASTGTLSNFNPTLPITGIAPGQSRTITATYTWTGGSTSVVFTATTTAYPCAVASTLTNTTGVVIVNPPCPDRYSFTISAAPNPLTLNSTNQAQITFTVTNTGNITMNLTNIVASTGTLSNFNPTLPITGIAPGQSRTITATYTWTGGSTSVVFTATTTAYPCAVASTLTNTTGVVIVNPPCPDRYSFTISAAPNPLTLNSTNQAQITFTVTNTGNITMNLTNIVASTGTLSNFNPTLPITGIAPGQSRTITATYTWTGGSTSVVFTATTTAYPCAVASTLTNTTGVVIVNPPCPDRYSFTISAAPNPLTLNSTNQAQITFTVTNTGNITMNLTNIVASTGTLSNFNPTLPITGIAPGQSRTITATYTWTGGSTSVVFTATTTAYPCAVASTLTNTTGVVIVNPPCPDRYSFYATAAPSPLNLNSTNQAQISITVVNTGNISITVNSIAPSVGTFTNSPPPAMPYTLVPGGSVTFTGTYTWVAGGSTNVIFTIGTNAYPCAVASTLTNTTGVVIVNPPCRDRYSFYITASPNPLTLNASNQAQLSITIVNTGNISITIPVNGITFSSGGSFTNPNPALPITIPPAPGSNSVTITGTYTHLPGAPGGPLTIFVSSNAYPCGASATLSNSTNVTIPCPPAAITISGPSRIVLNNSQATITFILTNLGSLPVTINSITPGAGQGSFVTAQLPVTVPGGSSTSVTGIYTYTGTLPINAVFTANGVGNVCGSSVPVSTNVTIPVSNCTDRVNLTISGPAFIQLNESNNASLVLTLRNTGTVDAFITAITASIGQFIPNPGQLPVNVRNNSQPFTVSGVYVYPVGAPLPATVVFTASGTATICGQINQVSTNTNSTPVNRSCSEFASLDLTGPLSIVLNPSTNQSTITLTLNNTGNVTLNLVNIILPPADGTFTNPNPALPISSIPPAPQNHIVPVTGLYTYNGPLPASAHFNATATASVCGQTRTVSDLLVIPVTNCPQFIALSITAPSTISLNSTNQAIITLRVTNNGNVSAVISAIVPSAGSFTPNAGQLPATLLPNQGVNITGVYSYGGAVPVNVTFTTSGSATVCGYAASANASINVTVGRCSIAAIEITGYMDDPVALINNTANLTLTIQNTGEVPLNVTGFTILSSFTFQPYDTLPVQLNPLQSRNFRGKLTYTGSGNPSSFQLTVLANTSAPFVCGGASANSTIVVAVTQLGDLTVQITTSAQRLGVGEGYANITVFNHGPGNITDSSRVNVTISRCTTPSSGSCTAISGYPTWYGVNPLDAGESYLAAENLDYACEGADHIFIRAWVNPDCSVSESNCNNNQDTATVSCSKETCEITGPVEIKTPDFYNYTAHCFDTGHELINCSDIMGSNFFQWTLSPASGVIMDYLIMAPEGANGMTQFIQVQKTLKNGTFEVNASGKLSIYDNTYINCTFKTHVYGPECFEQI